MTEEKMKEAVERKLLGFIDDAINIIEPSKLPRDVDVDDQAFLKACVANLKDRLDDIIYALAEDAVIEEARHAQDEYDDFVSMAKAM